MFAVPLFLCLCLLLPLQSEHSFDGICTIYNVGSTIICSYKSVGYSGEFFNKQRALMMRTYSTFIVDGYKLECNRHFNEVHNSTTYVSRYSQSIKHLTYYVLHRMYHHRIYMYLIDDLLLIFFYVSTSFKYFYSHSFIYSLNLKKFS